MSDEKFIDSLWAQDPALNEVIEQIQGYESWMETDESVLEQMNESMVAVQALLDRKTAGEGLNPISDVNDDLLTGMLVVLGFMPVKKAMYYLASFEKYTGFFDQLAIALNKAPPLKDHAKTLIARSSVLQQRELQKAVHSQENFMLLTQAIERVRLND